MTQYELAISKSDDCTILMRTSYCSVWRQFLSRSYCLYIKIVNFIFVSSCENKIQLICWLLLLHHINLIPPKAAQYINNLILIYASN